MNMIKLLAKKTIPHPLLSTVKRYAFYGIPDIIDFLSGKREEFIPPRRKIFIGGPQYKRIGDEFFDYFKKYGNIQPNHYILDVGSGIGRMARPFIRFLGPSGRFEGFDIDRAGVDWCRQNISVKAPNFRFQFVDIYNRYYNPSGKCAASKYLFPYQDNFFDFAFVTSVFTHMYMLDIERYIRELARVMKPGGRCLLSFFLWNPDCENSVLSGRSSIPMVKMDDCWVKSEVTPEEAICHPESRVLECIALAGLDLVAPVHYGSWCGREKYLSNQDIIIASKP